MIHIETKMANQRWPADSTSQLRLIARPAPLIRPPAFPPYSAFEEDHPREPRRWGLEKRWS